MLKTRHNLILQKNQKTYFKNREEYFKNMQQKQVKNGENNEKSNIHNILNENSVKLSLKKNKCNTREANHKKREKSRIIYQNSKSQGSFL